MEWVALLLFFSVIVMLLAGFPVAFSLGGTALLFALFGVIGGGFESAFLSGLPSRIFGIMTNDTLVAVPLFVFMGITLERARIAEDAPARTLKETSAPDSCSYSARVPIPRR